MATPDAEIIVDDPTAPADNSPPVLLTRTVDVITSLLLLGLAALFCFDNWRTGIAWETDGPQPGYFPFYLGVILAGASLYGLANCLLTRTSPAHIFLMRYQLRRVLPLLLHALMFFHLSQTRGLSVASVRFID